MLQVDRGEELSVLRKQFLTLKGESQKYYPQTTYQYTFEMPGQNGEVGVEGVVDAGGPTKAVLSTAFFDFFNHSGVSTIPHTLILSYYPFSGNCSRSNSHDP